jgi:hypothetical protein
VQHLGDAAGAWWASYITTLPDDHHVPWGEFRTAFCAHHLSAGLLRSKLKEFLDLEQGNHNVFVKDRRRQPEGVNGSQSKFLEGTRPMSQTRPDTPLF